MLPARLTVDRPALPHRLAAALALIAISLASLASGPRAFAQASDADIDADLAAGPLEAPLVDHSAARRTHNLVQQWVRDGAVPPDEAEGLSEIRVTGAFGVRVTLRLDGLTLGEGSAARPDTDTLLDGPGPALDLVALLQPAARQAMAAARDRLDRAHFRAVMGQVEGEDGTVAPTLAGIAEQLLVDVQIAHSLEPIQLRQSDDREAVFNHFAPGYHGLRSSVPDADADPDAALVWPATAIARRITPQGQVMQLLDAHGRDAEAIVQLGRSNGLPLQRFQVIHLVRPQLHLPVMHLVRGNVPLPPHSIDSRTLEELTSRMAQHLRGRFTSDFLVRGTYHPTGDRYDPPLAEARSAALASYALMRYARHRGRAVGIDDNGVRSLADAARLGAARITRMLMDQPEPANPATTALVLLTFVDDITPGEEADLRDSLTDRLLALYDVEDAEVDGFVTRNEEGELESAPMPTRALAAAALAAVYEQTRDQRLVPVLRQVMQRLWDDHDRSPNAESLPWLALAHHRAGRLLAEDDAARRQLAQRQAALGSLIDRIIDQQVIAPPQLGPADVIGGFELEPAPAGAPPQPDWRTAQLLSLLAVGLREPGIVGDRPVPDWALSAGLASRFIAQLMMDEPSSFYVRALDETLGGVRMSLWDNRLAVEPTAMSLLAAVQLQETLDQLAASPAD